MEQVHSIRYRKGMHGPRRSHLETPTVQHLYVFTNPEGRENCAYFIFKGLDSASLSHFIHPCWCEAGEQSSLSVSWSTASPACGLQVFRRTEDVTVRSCRAVESKRTQSRCCWSFWTSWWWLVAMELFSGKDFGFSLVELLRLICLEYVKENLWRSALKKGSFT